MFLHTKNTAWRVIEGRAFVINTNDSTLHELDETGTFIWKIFEKEASIKSVAVKLSREYDVTLENAQKDVTAFITTLIEKGLIRNEDK
jgi:hypothetical protein